MRKPNVDALRPGLLVLVFAVSLRALNAEQPLHYVQSRDSGAGRRGSDRRHRIAQDIAVELVGRYGLCVEIASTAWSQFNRIAGDVILFRGEFKDLHCLAVTRIRTEYEIYAIPGCARRILDAIGSCWHDSLKTLASMYEKCHDEHTGTGIGEFDVEAVRTGWRHDTERGNLFSTRIDLMDTLCDRHGRIISRGERR